MARPETRDARVRFPFANADNTMQAPGNQRIACTGAAQTYVFPAAMQGKYLYARAIGVEIQCAVADQSRNMVLDQISNAPAGTSSAACGMTLYAGEFFDRVCLGVVGGVAPTHFCWISRTATGFVEFFVSEG